MDCFKNLPDVLDGGLEDPLSLHDDDGSGLGLDEGQRVGHLLVHRNHVGELAAQGRSSDGKDSLLLRISRRF